VTASGGDGPSPWLRRRLVLDRAVAALLGVLVAPVVALLGYLVHRHDDGPALVRVPRVGRGGREFGMWKIRSMRAETSDGRATGIALTSSGDDRITPIGRRMRSLHLDELPQLLNVARGEMCLLGPRPEAPAFVDPADPRWQDVLEVPPGIAGPTQLIVGDWEVTQIDLDTTGTAYQDVVVPVKLAIDRWYVRSATPRSDLQVLLGLVQRVLPGPDSAALRRTVERAVPESTVASEPAATP
jgi:lipopolysaccharide/colanic/teichoic acid biosynthesis glycosyltransferase